MVRDPPSSLSFFNTYLEKQARTKNTQLQNNKDPKKNNKVPPSSFNPKMINIVKIKAKFINSKKPYIVADIDSFQIKFFTKS